MHVIVGLGNPGSRYDGTRHNLGFMFVDRFAALSGASFREGKGEFLLAHADIGGKPVAIVKPTTYMNQSGLAVCEALEMFEAAFSDTLIVFDDFQLPLGALRLRPRGSDGGHNGMASVIYQTGNEEIPRLRGGIGTEAMPADDDGKITFVLSPFAKDELPSVNKMIDSGAAAIRLFVENGTQAAMNEFNKTPDQSGPQD